MKKKIIILTILLALALIGYSIFKINLINKLNDYKNNSSLESVPVYVLDETTEDEDKFEYKNNRFTIPSFIDFNIDECSERGENIFVCEKDSELYLALIGCGDENSIDYALTIYGMLLATLNIDLSNYSFFTPINKLQKMENLALVRNIVSASGPQFITYGSQNAIVYKTKENYIIDIFGACSVIIKNDRELSDEELLDFIKTVETINIFKEKSIIIQPMKTYSVDESWKIMSHIHDSKNWMDKITMFEGIE